MMIARRCILRFWRKKGKGRDSDFINDEVSSVIEHYYMIDEFERPQTEEEFVRFCYGDHRSLSDKKWHKARVTQTIIDHKLYTSHQQSSSDREVSDLDSLDIMTRRYRGSVPPTQELHVYLLDLLRAVDAAPEEIRHAVNRLAYAGTILDYSKEHAISLFDAMAEQQRLREITRRIRDDLADERKFA